MKLLITGATGLLGSEIVRQLKDYPGNDFVSLVRNQNQLDQFDNPHLGDILDYPSLLDAFEGVNIVIHAAAKVSFSPKEKVELFEVNVDGTANVVNACLEKGVKRLIYISSVAAIGRPEKVTDTKQPISINESNKWEDSPINSEYAKSKYRAEQEVWRGQAEGLQTVILNPSVILGEADWKQSSTQLFNYVYQRNSFYTDGVINYVDVQDVANAVIQLIDSDIEDKRYIINAGSVTYAKFFGLMAKGFGVAPPKYKLKPFAIEILWRLEAIRAFIFRTSPLITKETAVTARAKIHFDNSRIKEDLQMEFIPLETSIKRVCHYLLNKNNQ
ncbi:NAD-dependent epimerase/dehydratase family protein [Jiulongibacter sediminis]|jgi:nucleoside-diphosphate-sugar epimerase|uniref:NAD-dependent epimerase/dehydratase family protein n=1 Tax=Jiulongibacter sediminis TaxID=1605367 RepID=UPI0026EFF2FA|nr:NAD-dependent epimerase/dehydratase family protein [Jiulongibacter sediminis]